MIIELILAALAVTAAGGAYAAYRRRRQDQQEAPPALMGPRQLIKGELKPRDVLVYLGTDYLVERVVTLQEGGRPVLVIAWVTDGSEAQHFIVDLKEKPRCVLAHARDGANLGRSIPRIVQEDAFEFRLSRRAALRFTCEGSSDFPSEGPCELGVYRGPGDRKAVVFSCEGHHLFLVGRGLTEEGIQMLQGDLTEGDGG
jgi:hypothetical protein